MRSRGSDGNTCWLSGNQNHPAKCSSINGDAGREWMGWKAKRHKTLIWNKPSLFCSKKKCEVLMLQFFIAFQNKLLDVFLGKISVWYYQINTAEFSCYWHPNSCLCSKEIILWLFCFMLFMLFSLQWQSPGRLLSRGKKERRKEMFLSQK